MGLHFVLVFRHLSHVPENYITFEYPLGNPAWWYEIVEGLPHPIVVDSQITVWDRPGMGVNLIPDLAQAHLAPEDADFFA